MNNDLMIMLKRPRREVTAFTKWLDRNGWEPYDSIERWLHLKTKQLLLTTTLFKLYKNETN